ncbi:hypothetical protein E1258_12875 [Micromonospora sp. KC207]|uniref:hypothetical protein n=1 Tax=Micromonospora sp. KC207 TaxID=2530377 RepID=UPI0010457905|nr:hypothetical protein [Micromonospora sp. KC207]TDC61029.1 hypothetical protein E1258_12875 [Micromonospora sp. KC207]
MNLPTLLDLIAGREATAGQTVDRLLKKITTLTAEPAQIECEPADLKVTRTTLRTLAAAVSPPTTRPGRTAPLYRPRSRGRFFP